MRCPVRPSHVPPLRTSGGCALERLGPPRGSSAASGRTIVLAHGMFSSRRSLLPLGRFLASRGHDVWTVDFRGHGDAAALEPDEDFERAALRDVPDVLAAVRDAAGTATLDWIGHSGGGLAALMFLVRHPEARGAMGRMVLAASQATASARRPANRLKLQLIRLGCLGRRRVGAARFGLGDELENVRVLDQWVRWNLARRWTGSDGLDYLEALAAVRLPTLALCAGADRFIAPVAGCRAVHDALGGEANRFVECSRERGFADDFGHGRLVLSKPARALVWPRIANWLEGGDDETGQAGARRGATSLRGRASGTADRADGRFSTTAPGRVGPTDHRHDNGVPSEVRSERVEGRER